MLQLSPLTLGYDGKPIVRFGGMTLADGGQCLITGPSGCGKTTLFNAIAGLSPVMEGQIHLDGTDIGKLSETGRDHFRGKHIGIIFQTLHLIKSLTVVENLLLASYVAGQKQDHGRVNSVLKVLGIYDKQNALPEQLSQGQAQRVAIARAVLHKPSLILADEPTSSLDDASCEAVLALIKQVAQESGAALIISTHDARVKAHFSQIITMGGRA